MRAATDWGAVSFAAVFGLVATITVVVLVGPTLVILLLSFTGEESLHFPPTSYSLRWYAALLDANEIQDAALVSLEVAAIAVCAAVLLGVPAALAIARSRGGWARGLDMLFMSPLILPALAFGFASLMLFSLLGVRPSLATLAIGHVVISVPFVIRTTLASLVQLDPALLDCSLSLGATPLRTFRRVTLPLVAPGLAGGWILAFITSFDELTVSLFLASPSANPLPVQLFNYIDQMTDPLVASVSSALILVTAVAMVALDRFYPIDRLLTGERRA